MSCVPRWAAVLLLVPAFAAAAEWTARPLAELAAYAELRVPAVVVPVDESRLSAEVTGRIEALPARAGKAFSAGEALARIDDRGYRIELERARAALALVDNRIRLAESLLAQAEALAGRRFLSDEVLSQRRTELAVLASERDAARAGLAAARLALERTIVRAPFDGVVRERLASVGELATPGTPLLVLAASRDAEVRAEVPIAELDGLQHARERLLDAGGRRIALEIRRISPLVERAGQTREVVFTPASALPPGLAGELRWRSPQPLLPADYLQSRAGLLGAFVVEQGEAVFRPLPQAQSGRAAAVDWPLDTLVVDEGRMALGLGSGRAR